MNFFIRLLKSIGFVPLAGAFWRMGGSGNYSRYWRRAGVAGLVTLKCLWDTKSFWALVTYPLAFGAYTLGYGLPDATDSGSALGAFWYKLFKNQLWALVATRTTVALGYSLNYLVKIILTQHYCRGAIAMTLLTLGVPLVCLFRFKAEKEEFIIGSLVLGCTFII